MRRCPLHAESSERGTKSGSRRSTPSRSGPDPSWLHRTRRLGARINRSGWGLRGVDLTVDDVGRLLDRGTEHRSDMVWRWPAAWRLPGSTVAMARSQGSTPGPPGEWPASREDRSAGRSRRMAASIRRPGVKLRDGEAVLEPTLEPEQAIRFEHRRRIARGWFDVTRLCERTKRRESANP